MSIEEQVTNYQLAQMLKELSIEQESLWYWINDGKKVWVQQPSPSMWIHTYSAFTVSELGKLLPYGFWCCKNIAYKKPYESSLDQHTERGLTEADSRAKLLIYITKKK